MNGRYQPQEIGSAWRSIASRLSASGGDKHGRGGGIGTGAAAAMAGWPSITAGILLSAPSLSSTVQG